MKQDIEKFLDKNPNASLKEYYDYVNEHELKLKNNKNEKEKEMQKFMESLKNTYHIIKFNEKSIIVFKIGDAKFTYNYMTTIDSETDCYGIYSLESRTVIEYEKYRQINLRWINLNLFGYRNTLIHKQITKEEYNELTENIKNQQKTIDNIFENTLKSGLD